MLTMTRSIEEIRRGMPGPVGRDLLTEMWNAEWNAPSMRAIETLGLAVGTHPGSQRSRNEDRAVVAQVKSSNGQCFAVALVCDGVGGTEMGDMAATVAVATCIGDLAELRQAVAVRDLLPRLIRNMDEVVRRTLNGKGATTVSILLASSKGDIASTNVGDSRLFSWAPGEHSFRQISVDDTLENELKNLPGKDLSALNARGLQGSLSQALGEVGRPSSDLRIVVFGRDEFNRGAVLASDGAWKAAADGFNATVQHAPSALDLVRRVITSALWTGGVDNVSVVAVQNIEQFIRSTVDAPPAEFRRNRVIAWFADMKLVLCDLSDHSHPGEDSRRPDFRPEGSGDQPEKKEKRKSVGRNKKQLPIRDKLGSQLELKVDPENRGAEQPGDAKPKIVISTDDEPPKSE